MSKEKLISITKHILLGFVLITIGFAIGKEVTSQRMQKNEPDTINAGTGTDQVIVAYAHASIRCVSCNTIEKLIHETLSEQFAHELAKKRIILTDVNFQKDTAFAKKYEIVANCVVLRQIKDGKETAHKQLYKIWDLYEDAPAFKKYLSDEIRASLNSLTEG